MTPEQNLVGIETKLEKIKHDADDKVKGTSRHDGDQFSDVFIWSDLGEQL